MRSRFFETAFTPSVQAEQERHGSRAAYARIEARRGGADDDLALTRLEAEFIANRDSFYLATVSASGWPHVQHRGGPEGFVRILDRRTLGWADFRGNRQYITIGNAADNDRVALIFMDYRAQRRLKVLGRMRSLELDERPALRAELEVAGYGAKVEHAIEVTVEAFDWNCPQHITPRFTEAEVTAIVAPLRRQIAELQARLDPSAPAARP